jgi:hypothetical protein
VHSILLGGKRMGTAQARVVMSVLVLGMLGGSAELARCPQLVSFSRAGLPVAAETQSSAAGLGYAPVAFRGSGNVSGAPHETLLKASMPVGPSMPVDRGGSMSSIEAKGGHAASALAVKRARQQVRQRRARVQQAGRWVVLTSWSEDGPERPGMVLSVGQERVIFTSYAAVPTAGGWLVIQL